MSKSKQIFRILFVSLCLLLSAVAVPPIWDGKLVEWGTMRETIGQGQSQGRGTFSELTSRSHLYALGAVAGLKGEATVLDGRVVVTQVSCCGQMTAVTEETVGKVEVTYLLGSYVDAWNEQPVESETGQLAFEQQLREAKADQPWKSAVAFPFVLEGELLNARVHVVNGACPMHARLNELELPDDKKPFEKTYNRLSGQVLGFFSDNSVGVRTHPGTSVHAHVVFVDPESGDTVTGHLERFTVASGTSLKLPK